MSNQGINENDWKLFRKKVPGWQEAYMDRLNKEYLQLLSKDADPSEIFWELEKRINTDKRRPGVCLDMRRSRMTDNLIQLINDGTITLDDLSGFSDDLREAMHFLFRDRSDSLQKGA